MKKKFYTRITLTCLLAAFLSGILIFGGIFTTRLEVMAKLPDRYFILVVGTLAPLFLIAAIVFLIIAIRKKESFSVRFILGTIFLFLMSFFYSLVTMGYYVGLLRLEF